MAQETLPNGEQVVLDIRPHWWFFSRQALALIVAVGLGIVVLTVNAPSALNLVVGVLVLAAVLWFGVRYVAWTTTNFVLTTDRIISRDGILSRSGTEIPLERINTVFFKQTLFERMIRSGDLSIESAGEKGSSNFTDIRRPLDVQSEIYTQMEANENRKFDRVGHSIAAQAGGQTESIPDQIRKLDELRRIGALTGAEFEAKKAELLRRL